MSEAIEQTAARRAFAVSVFLINKSHVLLIKHVRLGLWLPVGGELEKAAYLTPGEPPVWETPIEAARREVREETGFEDITFITMRDVYGSPPGLVGYEEHGCGSKGLHMCFSFAARVDSRVIVSDGSFTDVRWLTIREVARLSDDETTMSVRQLACRALSLDASVRL